MQDIIQSILCFLSWIGCTSLFDVISLLVGILSIGLAIFSICYAFKCNAAANKTNKQTSDMLLDMQYMMAFNLRALCGIQRRLYQAPNDDGVVRLTKDSVKLHKLSTYSKENANKIMSLLSKLSIKKNILTGLQKFIESDETDRTANFFSSAETVDKSRLDDIVAELIKYGLLIDVYYN